MTDAPFYAVSEACDQLVRAFDAIIDRHFAVNRIVVVERESAKHWTASIGDDVLYRSPDQKAVVRFAQAFAQRTPGVTLELTEWFRYEHDERYSVRVDNVVPLRA